MIKIRKLLAIVLTVLILSSSVVSVNAVASVDNDTGTSVSSQEATVQEDDETETEETTSAEESSATAATSETTEATTAKATEEAVSDKTDISDETNNSVTSSITSAASKVTSKSVSASLTATSIVASTGASTTYTLSGIQYTTSSGTNKSLYTAKAKVTTDSNDDATTIVFTLKATSSSATITATWRASDGRLTVTGNGEIPNFREPTTDSSGNTTRYTPWYDPGGNIPNKYFTSESITEIVIDTGITKIGNNAFRGLSSLKTLYFSSGTSKCTSIGELAFWGCSSLASIYFRQAPIATIGKEAFRGCSALIYSTVNGSTTSVPDTIAETSSSVFADKNVFTLPDTVETIGAMAFNNCSLLRLVTWGSNSTASTPSLTTIKYAAFKNCYNLRYFSIPDSCTTIEGTVEGQAAEGNTSLYGAFYVDSDYSPTVTFYLGINQKKSSCGLETIGRDAFRKYNAPSSTQAGVKLYDEYSDAVVNSGTTVHFSSLTSIGMLAFMNNPVFTGNLYFDQYINIGRRAFTNTSLTDIFFKWDPDSRATSTNKSSSQIGSSNQFVSASNSMGYTDSTYGSAYGSSSSYFSLYSLINDEQSGLLKLWQSAFAGISSANTDFDGWTADYSTPSPTQPESYPEVSDGEYLSSELHSSTATDPNTNKKTKPYIKTETEWTTVNKKASETVTFGYKNETKVDFVFVVDCSPSMDDAADTSGASYSGTYNASKLMNEFSQIYDISEQVLGSSGNTVSIVAFNGNETNQLSASSKSLGKIGMTTASAVYTALFNTDDGYDDGGVTNYSAGLSRAYYVLEELQTTYSSHEQVVIMLTDGDPTYVSASGSTTGVEYDDTSKIATQVNGVDWANAIKGSTSSTFSVRNYSTSKTDNYTTQSVSGLNVSIYGILVGADSSYNLNKVTSSDSDPNDYSNTRGNTNITELATDLSDIIKSATAENYTVVIPLDDNFTYSGTVTLTNSATGKTLTGSIPSNSFTATSEYGALYYDTSRNRIIWELSTCDASGSYDFITSSPYITYTLTFTLNYSGDGKIESYNDSYYAAVNDNDSDTSRNANDTASLGKKSLDADWGAYVYLSSSHTLNSVPISVESTATLIEAAPAIYLEVPTGDVIIKKYTDDDTSSYLSGVTFYLYSENDLDYNVCWQYTGTKEYTYNGYSGISSLDTNSTNYLKLIDLPYGTYYLVETVYPETDSAYYRESAKNTYTSMTINSAVTNTIKITVSSSTQTVTVYNTEILKSTILRGKVGYVASSGRESSVVGATVALYDNYSDASSGNSNYIARAVTDSSGWYVFNVDAADIYYVRVISMPDDYQKVNTALSVEVSQTQLDNSSTVSAQELYTFEYGTLNVYVGTSDNKPADWNFTLVGDMSDTSTSSVTYTGTSDEDGYLTFKIPLYYIDSSTYGAYYSNEQYTGITYTLTETSYGSSSSIPSRYIYQEYGTYNVNDPFSNVSKADNYSYTTGSSSTYTGSPLSQYNSGLTNSTKSVAVYNPSIKLKISNYDATDRTTPLESTFNSRGFIITTDSTGSGYYPYWLGYSSGSITQTKVEDGYNLLSAAQSYTISSSSNLTTAYDEDTGLKYYEYEVVVYNSKPADIPTTGSFTALILTICGLSLLSVGLFLVIKKRKGKNKGV